MKVKLLISILFLAVCGLFAQNTTEIFTENFYSNAKDWSEGSDSERSYSVRDGHYYFEYKKESGGYNSYQKVEIDESKDFVLETKIRKISGIDNYGFGILWGCDIDGKKFIFHISSNGYFRVDNNGEDLKKWTTHSAIKKGNNATNILKVQKKGSTLTFYINNTYVYSTAFVPFYGDWLGFNIMKNQKLAIDYLKIYYLNKIQNNNNTTSTNHFYETFSNNNQDWIIGSNKDRSFDLKYGKYYFDHKVSSGSYVTHKGITIDTNRDFKIESTIYKVSGVENYGYGIIWGRKDKDNQNQFVISGNGYFTIYTDTNGKTNEIKPWTINGYIKQNNGSTNKLSIVKKGSSLKFYVNDYLVHTSPFKPFFGNRIGWVVDNKQKIGIDDLKISYLTGGTTSSDYALNEQFTSNTRYWPTSGSAYFYDGKYYLNKSSEDGGEYQSIYATLDDSRKFQIDTEIKKISGVENSGFGLIFGRKDASNQFLFNITATGYYRISKFESAKYTNIVDWTLTDHVNKNNGSTNKLTVKKEGGKYKFYINDQFTNSIDYTPLFGKNIGYVTFSKQKTAADYLTIKYLDTKKNVVVVNNNYDSKDYFFFEEFVDNSNNWTVTSNNDYNNSISGGKFHIEHKLEKGGWYFGKYTKIDESKDYEVETTIERKSSIDNGSLAFVFGRKDNDNKYELFISKNGSYLVRKFINGEKTILINWTESSYIAGGNAPNKIKLKKTGSTLRLYVNNQYLNKLTIDRLPGYNFGYVVYGRTKIAVDNLKIKYLEQNYNLAPEIEIFEPKVVSRGFSVVKSKKITVKGKATDKDGIYEVTINGVDAYVSSNGNFSAEVPLKFGDNELLVKASDIKGKSASKKFFIKRESPVIINDNDDDDIVVSIDHGQYYALLIGVSDYGDSKIVDLEGLPNKDAQGLATLLKTKYNFKSENVKVLINATRTDIIKAFDNLRSKLTDKDNLLIFYAGHGVYEEDSEVGYWLPADAEKNYTANWIQNSVVVSTIKRIKAKHTLLISDACFSGSIFRTRSLTNDAPKAVKKLYELPSRKAITSGTLKTVPNKSVFYKYLIDRLNNNTSKYLSAFDLFGKLKTPVANNSPNIPQYGVIHGIGDEGGDFIFIKK